MDHVVYWWAPRQAKTKYSTDNLIISGHQANPYFIHQKEDNEHHDHDQLAIHCKELDHDLSDPR